MADVGIRIGAEDATKGAFDSVNRGLGGMANAARSAQSTLAALGIGVSLGSLAAFVKGAINAADETSKLAQKIGVATGDIAGLQLAFRQADAADAFATSMAKMSKSVADGSKAFVAMGINTKNSDGSLRSTRQLLGEVSDKFAGYADGMAKTALAQEVFGKSGANLLPLLNAGSRSLDEYDAMAKKLGLTLSEDTGTGAEKFNDTLDLVGQSMQGMGRQIAAQLLPTLNGLAGSFFDSMTSGDKLKKTADFLATGLKGLYVVALGVVEVFTTVGKVLGGVGAAVVAALTGDFSGAVEILKDMKQEVGAGWKDTLAQMQSAWSATGSTAVEAMAATQKALKGTAPLVADVAAKVKKAADAFGALRDKITGKESGTDSDFLKNLMLLKSGFDSGRVGLEEYLNLADAYVASQKYSVDATKAQIKAMEDADKSRHDYSRTTSDSLAQMRGETLAMEGRNARLGLTALAIADLDAAELKLQATKLDGLAIDRLVQYQDSINFEQLKSQADEKRKQAELIRSGAGASAALDEAKKAEAEWAKFYDSIYNGLTDSLYRAFESGKGFFKSFWDGIKNLFKTTVLKLAIQGVVGGVTGAMGMTAANAATGGSGGGSLLGMAGNLNTANSMLNGSFLNSAGSFGGLFASNAAYGAAIGTTSIGAGSQAAMLAAQTGQFGLAGATATSSAAGGAMGGATAALTAIPVWGWVALAAIAVAGMFGGRGKKESTGGGIEGNFGNAGFAGNSFSTWKQDGGWFRSDRTGKETGALDSATSKQFSDSYKAVQMAASGAALALGLSADAVTNYSQAISLQLGSDAAANGRAITALFTGIGDNMARAVAPGIAQLAKEGETAGGTLSRLAVSLTAANAWLDRFGANMLQVSLAGGDAASKLADLFGGLENLNTASSAFYATYFSEAERAAQSTEDMGKALGALGLALPDSKEAFRALALSMDQTTDAGRAAYATLLLIAPEFATTTDALATMATEATAAIESLFAKLSDGIKSAIDSIAGERGAVAAAVLQINNPGVMSRDAILRGISGTALATPGNAGLSAAQTALGQADAAVAAQAAAVAYARTQTPSRAALDAAAAAVAAAPAPNRDAYAVAATGFSYVNGEIPTEGWMETSPASFDQAGYDAAVMAASAPARAAYDAQAAAYGNAAAINAAQVATEQAKLSAATAAQANAVTAAKNAQLAYIASLQDFAIDASKATAKLGTLREETLKYYDAQKQLADLMTTSATGLRGAVSAARTGQLDPAQSLAQQQGGFASAYSMALATSGAEQAGYADKLTAALPGLSTALMDAASTREEWARATGTLFAQSEAIAQQLEANAPQDYAADSLAMLGQIDAALLVLDASSKSAEKIIADAVTAGSENTANGLRAVIAALTGSPIPAFALGGSFGGGLRIVGENGPELEATGPSRIFSASQTRSMLGGGGSDEMVQELRALRQEVAGLRAEAQATAGHTSKTARLLDRAMPDGDALATRAAV